MCGIVGYVGAQDATPILLGALARLEYRGYDSAGIATIGREGNLEIRRAVGKLVNLRAALKRAPLSGAIGIGHTRWATHGRPSEENAHPHQAGPVAVIHNGIVENYLELRAELIARRHRLRSETDTELISHLIEENLNAGMPLTEAVRATVLKLRGSFSIVVLARTEPDRLIAAKSATPLVIGLGEGENFIASDIPAILTHTRRTVVLEDGELAEVTSAGVRIMNFDGTAVERAPSTIEWDAASASRGGFRHFLRKEIGEQPQAWIDTLAGRVAPDLGGVTFEEDPAPATGAQAIGRIVAVGAGTSYYASLIGKYLIEELTGIPVQVELAAEFRYRRPAIDERTMVIAVSQSGETADTMAAMNEARARGSRLLAITNTLDSSIARRADTRLYTRCGPEVSVASTKSFIAQVEALYLLAIHLAARRGRLSPPEVETLLRPAFAIPAQIETILAGEQAIAEIARRYARARDFFYLGRGLNYPVALEGALKLKEISYIHAEGYSAGEMKHGPIALIDREMPVVVIIPGDNMFEKTLSNLKEVESRSGRIIAVTDRRAPELEAVAEELIEIPTTHRLLMPVLATVPLQLLAYHTAVARGTDVDQPRNLAKAVTVE